jgi:putative transposase
MPNYRRVRDARTYFFTVVTWQRQPILCLDLSRRILRELVDALRATRPFDVDAWVLLPDHLHCIWTLPEGDPHYSARWGWIKKELTRRIADRGDILAPSASRRRHREGGVWQRRFWEHRIRDETDFVTQCDYIHYNPVKHGLVSAPRDWPYSTFHRFARAGRYPADWGAAVNSPSTSGFGE